MSSRDRDIAAALANIATTHDGVFLGLTAAVVAAVTWVKYFETSAALGRINAAPSVPISGLRSLLSSVDADSDDKPLLVVVRGQVQPRSALEAVRGWSLLKTKDVLASRGSDQRAVAILRTQKVLYNEFRGVFGWSSNLHALFTNSWKERSSSLTTVPFVLVEGGTWPNSGYVHVSLEGSAHPLPLTTVHHETHPVQVTPYTIVQAIFGSYPVALLDEEKILPVGKEITAIGICRERDESIEIKSLKNLPCFLSGMTKEEIVIELSSHARILFWCSIIFGTVSVGMLGYALTRKLLRWKEMKTRGRQIDDPHNQALVASTTQQEDVPDGELCVICLVRRRKIAFAPCGHRVCCESCAMLVEVENSPTCPLCRQDVRSSLRIYDS